MHYFSRYHSPLGTLTLLCDEDALIGLYRDTKNSNSKVILKDTLQNDNYLILKQTKEWLDRYFRGERPDISELKLKLIGGEFRQEVWSHLLQIPYGSVITYNDIAKKIALKRGIKKMSAQAVGGAVGNNPISIIVPCHRVIGASGNLIGYSGGMDMKIKLLKIESVDMSEFYEPKK